MLSPLDDMLWHQLPTTFDHVGTSDPRFFDRVWFAFYDPAGGRAAQYTLAAYSNMNVMDGGMTLVDGDSQHNLRASRALRPAFELECAPLRMQIIEPFKRFRLVAHEDQQGVSADIEWSAVEAPLEEEPHFHRRLGRVLEDYRRFNQIGKANGSIRVGDRRIEVADWWGCRDHSWGVRPRIGGIKEPGPSVDERSNDTVFSFLFFSTATLAGQIQARLDGDAGNYFSASLVDRTRGAPLAIEHFSMRVELIPGTRLFQRLHFTLHPRDDEPLRIETGQVCNGIVMAGLGYSGGWNDRRGLGAWRGTYHQERDLWDTSDRELVGVGQEKKWRPLHRIYPVRVKASDGSAGMGSQTWLMTGDVPAITTTGVDSEET
jgi:hypothetical protein